MNTGTISLYIIEDQFSESGVIIDAHKDPEGVYVSVKADENTPIIGLTLTSDEAQALIASLKNALKAHESAQRRVVGCDEMGVKYG